jgi:hypothetical protein
MARATIIHNTTAGDGRPTGGELRAGPRRRATTPPTPPPTWTLTAPARPGRPRGGGRRRRHRGAGGRPPARPADIPWPSCPSGPPTTWPSASGSRAPSICSPAGGSGLDGRPSTWAPPAARGAFGRSSRAAASASSPRHARAVRPQEGRGQDHGAGGPDPSGPAGPAPAPGPVRAPVRRPAPRWRVGGRRVPPGRDHERAHARAPSPLRSHADPTDGRLDVVLVRESDRRRVADWLDEDPDSGPGLETRPGRHRRDPLGRGPAPHRRRDLGDRVHAVP